MSKEEVGDDWDFSPVIDLIYSLSPKSESLQPLDNGYGKYSDPCLEAPLNPLPKDEKDVSKDSEAALGNFDSVWQFLRRPVDIPSEKNVPGTKEVRWRDEINGADLADDDEDDGKSLSGLTKTQRKKARRKQRHKEEANGFRNGKIIPTSDENESEPEPKKLQTPDRKAIISQILHGEKIRVLKRPAEEKSKHQAAAKKSARAVAAARKEKLMIMLKERFIEERPYLSNLSLIQHPDTGASNTNEGIHIFVDASNIMIGFQQSLRKSTVKTLDPSHQPTFFLPWQPFSFHTLSLILSRSRPTAKRILVGSDNFPCIAEAKAIGYETNILDRVHKAKELTPRQKYFLARDSHPASDSAGNGKGGRAGQAGGLSAGSGSETATVVYAPEKWVEQAVDEILHLKMMESIVDATAPSTMVLATGDAAEAEYSGGFLKMVERALNKGWKVELASFRDTTSGAYKSREFRKKWGKQFRRVELDDFVEFLVGGEGERDMGV